MANPIGKSILRLRGLIAMDPSRRRSVLRSRLGAPILRRWRQGRRRAFRLYLRGIERAGGVGAANRAFWNGPASQQNWSAVRIRLNQLAERAPNEITPFVEAGFAKTADPLVLTRLASHPLTRTALTGAMRAEAEQPDPQISERLERSAQYSAAFAAAAAQVLDDAGLDALRDRIAPDHAPRYIQLLDSFGFRPAGGAGDAVLRHAPHTGLRGQGQKRLVITETLSNPEAFLPLLQNTGQVTLLALNDTYGKARLDAFSDMPGIADVTVEHVRSRITRFSQRYIEIHERTRNDAQSLALVASQGLLEPDFLPYLELAIADYLFFQALKLEAIREVLADDGFDHVVIALQEHRAGSSFLLLMSAFQDLLADPRCEILSVSESTASRLRFDGCLETLATGPRPPQLPLDWLPPLENAAANLDSRIDAIAGNLPLCESESGRPGALLATTNNPAYNASTGAYAAALLKDLDLRIAFVGGNATQVHHAMTADGAPAAPIHFLRQSFPKGFEAMTRRLTAQCLDLAASLPQNSVVRHIIRMAPGRLATEVIQSHIIYSRMVQAWFARMDAEDALPRMVFLSPNRPPNVGLFAAVARRHNVPSIALEAHGLNANYSRYINVVTDYYGVISGYFRDHAAEGFGIPAARTRVVGTPRLVVPQGHDLDTARAAARQEIGAETGHDFADFSGTAVFFCQPSAWFHVAKVWTSILHMAGELNMGVLLKPHPEDSPSRIERYLSLSAGMEAAQRVTLLQGPAARAVEASDIVLTGYSAAALDAALLQVPVVCVTDGPGGYPVDQHEIAGGPLVHSAAELTAAVRAVLEDPGAARTRAAQFLEREPQFVTGPEPLLRAMAQEILEAGEAGLRPENEVPASIFLPGPHPVFPV